MGAPREGSEGCVDREGLRGSGTRFRRLYRVVFGCGFALVGACATEGQGVLSVRVCSDVHAVGDSFDGVHLEIARDGAVVLDALVGCVPLWDGARCCIAGHDVMLTREVHRVRATLMRDGRVVDRGETNTFGGAAVETVEVEIDRMGDAGVPRDATPPPDVGLDVVDTSPRCDDRVQNGDEAGVDCGGSVCPPCVVCGGLPDGTPCGEPHELSCDACVGSSACDTNGVATCQVMVPTCHGGVCGGEVQSQDKVCTRLTEGMTCEEPDLGVWSACTVLDFANPCAVQGRRTRSRTTHACVAAACQSQEEDDEESCSLPSTDGDSCGLDRCFAEVGCSGTLVPRSCVDEACVSGTPRPCFLGEGASCVSECGGEVMGICNRFGDCVPEGGTPC